MTNLFPSSYALNFGNYSHHIIRPKVTADLGSIRRSNDGETKVSALPRPQENELSSGCKTNPLYNLRGRDAAMTLDAQLQKMIDEELAGCAVLNSSYNTDPDESISKHMEASLRLWNKLTEIRNNYKLELKKKQEERLSFENDLRAATAQTSAEIAMIERELDSVNKEISNAESQLSDAENYKRKIEEETKLMENELKNFAIEDETLQRELSEVTKAVESAEEAIIQAEADFNRFKLDAEKEISQAEAAYNKEIELKDQQIAASTAELQQLETELTEFSRRNPKATEIQQFREELQRLKTENDLIKAEIHQIQQHNTELRKNGENLLACGEENLRKEQAANQAEDEKMNHEIQCMERKLQSIESHIQQLEQEKEQLEKQCVEVESQIEKMQHEIQTTKGQLKEKEQTMKEMCELIEKQENLEQELESKYAADMRQLERKHSERIRDIKNQMMACSQKKQENMAKIRNVCQEIKEAKDKLKEAESKTQETFRKLKSLTDEYDAIKRQNERSEEFISFYDTIRSYETKYVELKEALTRAKNQRDYLKTKDTCQRSSSPVCLELPKLRMRLSPKTKDYGRRQSQRRDSGRGLGVGGNENKGDFDLKNYKKNDTTLRQGKHCGKDSEPDISRRTIDPLSDPLIKAYFKLNKSRNK